MSVLDIILFIVFPYLAVFVCLVGALYRYKNNAFSVSSLSSQFLESGNLFWGVMFFHWALLIVLAGHLFAFLFPKGQLLWNTYPIRLIILEVAAFTFGILIFVGLVIIISRRLFNERVRCVTSPMDLCVEFLLLVQVILGCWIALGYRWGSSWFAADLSPYLWSLVKFQPTIKAVSQMPLVIKLHILGAFTLILLIPFSRLMHFLVAPLHYIWRPYQVVIWNWKRQHMRLPETVWTQTRPKNN